MDVSLSFQKGPTLKTSLGLLASRNVRQDISILLSHLVCGSLIQQH